MICPNCGSELKPGASFCVSCGSPVSAPAPAPAPQQPVTITTEPAKQENFAKGLIGALIGALVGGAAIFLLGKAEMVASFSGLVLAFLTFFLYEKMGGGLSKKGLIVCVLLIVVTPFLAYNLLYANQITEVFKEIIANAGFSPEQGVAFINHQFGTEMSEISEFETLGNLSQLLKVSDAADAYWGDIAQLYLYTGLGAVALIASKFSKKKK